MNESSDAPLENKLLLVVVLLRTTLVQCHCTPFVPWLLNHSFVEKKCSITIIVLATWKVYKVIPSFRVKFTRNIQMFHENFCQLTFFPRQAARRGCVKFTEIFINYLGVFRE